jgi:hypothetical protein
LPKTPQIALRAGLAILRFECQQEDSWALGLRAISASNPKCVLAGLGAGCMSHTEAWKRCFTPEPFLPCLASPRNLVLYISDKQNKTRVQELGWARVVWRSAPRPCLHGATYATLQPRRCVCSHVHSVADTGKSRRKPQKRPDGASASSGDQLVGASLQPSFVLKKPVMPQPTKRNMNRGWLTEFTQHRGQARRLSSGGSIQ